MNEQFIYIARHAWAYEYGDPRWPDDSQRELEPKGVKRFAKMVQALADRGFAPQVTATSPYKRCRQTAEIIAEHTSHHPDVVELPALEPGSDSDQVIAWSKEMAQEHICWVGHAPDVTFLTAGLIGARRANIRFAKGAVAAVRVHEELGADCGQLYWHATAKLLGL